VIRLERRGLAMKKRVGSILTVLVALLLWSGSAGVFGAEKAKTEKVDINSASQSELETLPGVGPALAKRIIENRPYSSASGLSKAGVPDSTIDKLRPLVKAGRGTRAEAREEKAAAKSEKAEKKAEAEKKESPAAESRSEKPARPSGEKIDINTASAAELEALPGVGAATARKIMENRPYSSVGDLSRAGVSDSTIEKIRGMVKASRVAKATEKVPGRAAEKAEKREPAREAPAARAEPPRAAERRNEKPASAGGPVDLNTASESDLEALPGIGVAYAKRIVENRPYSSVAELSKAGVPASTIEKIRPMVKASAAAASRAYQPPPSKGMVWVNKDTKVYHREGDQWYGRTVHGEYMRESDAIKAGYRLSKQKIAG
jgi:competence protein ComEA